MHIFPRHFQSMLDLDPHVLDDDIGMRNQSHEGLVTLGRFQVELDHPLIAMEVLVVGAVAKAEDFIAAAFGGRLDADDVGAPVREMAHRGRPRARERQVEHS